MFFSAAEVTVLDYGALDNRGSTLVMQAQSHRLGEFEEKVVYFFQDTLNAVPEVLT